MQMFFRSHGKVQLSCGFFCRVEMVMCDNRFGTSMILQLDIGGDTKVMAALKRLLIGLPLKSTQLGELKT